MTTVATAILSKREAERLTTSVLANLTAAGEQLMHLRATLLELHEGRAWEALGYDSWPDYCRARFQKQYAWCYQQVQAAKIERMLALEPGTLPLRTAQALAPVAQQPEAAREAYRQAQAAHGPAPTAPQVRAEVRRFTPIPKGSQGVKGRGAVGKFADVSITREREPDSEMAHVTCPSCGTTFPLPALET